MRPTSLALALVLVLAPPAGAQQPSPSCEDERAALRVLAQRLENVRSDIEHATAWEISRRDAALAQRDALIQQLRAELAALKQAAAPPAPATPPAPGGAP